MLTSLSRAGLLLMVHSEELEVALRVLRMTGCLEAWSSYTVISTKPTSLPCFTKSFTCDMNHTHTHTWSPRNLKRGKKRESPLVPQKLTSLALPRREVEPPRPRHMAHTILDFPVPTTINHFFISTSKINNFF